MKLANEDIKEIIIFIITHGGKTFLETLLVADVPHNRADVYFCIACSKEAKKRAVTYTITDQNRIRMFSDRFNKPRCTRNIIAWIRYLYSEFLKYLGDESRVLTVDDLCDINVRNKLNHFRSRRLTPISRIREFVAGIKNGDEDSEEEC